MKKIRYMLALSNITLSDSQKDKIAGALLSGCETRERRKEFNKKTLPKILALIIAVITVGAVFGVISAVRKITSYEQDPQKTAESAVTADTEGIEDPGTVTPVNRTEYLRITPMYQNDKIYDLFRLTALHTSVNTEEKSVTVNNIKEIADLFNAKESDYTDIVTSLFAFAEPDRIGFVSETWYPEAEARELILASVKEGTFERLVTITVLVYENNVYLADYSLLLSSVFIPADERPDPEDLIGHWRKAGYVYRAGDGCVYMIDTDKIDLTSVYKIRIEGGLPVIYDHEYIKIANNEPEKILADGYLTIQTAHGEDYFTYDGIIEGNRKTVFTNTEKKPVTVGAEYKEDDILIPHHFPATPLSERGEVCDIINEYGCDWFFYLYNVGGKPVGVPLWLTDEGKHLRDRSGDIMYAYFDPYNCAAPAFDFDLSVQPDIVTPDGGDFTNIVAGLQTQILAPDDGPEYAYYENAGRFTAYGLEITSARFSTDLYISEGYVSKTRVCKTSGSLLDFLGIGYDPYLPSPSRFSTSDDGFTESVYQRYGTTGGEKPLYWISPGTDVTKFRITGAEPSRYISSKSGKTCRVDTLYGYKILDNGIILDLDDRVIGFTLTVLSFSSIDSSVASASDISFVFCEPSAPLYVLSDEKGLCYIGCELPDNRELFFPFEYAECRRQGDAIAGFFFGYIEHKGPYILVTDYTVKELINNSDIYGYSFTVEDPEYAQFSFNKYNDKTHSADRITAGKYGDRLIQTCGGTAYRTERASGVTRRSGTISASAGFMIDYY